MLRFEEPGRTVALLADGEGAFFVAVLHAHSQLLRTRRPQRGRDVRTELGVATFVARHLFVVHPNRGDLVDRAEVKQRMLVVPVARNLKYLAVPHLIVVALDARQRDSVG